ncbi:hypothetical protein NKJ84_02085 [Mesorhizobium sp. M0048]|uniref:hypothetical protein n=1 Tax=Mesorhizobium sp. M0048 TaxID=2956860 RepID=UPI00333A3585
MKDVPFALSRSLAERRVVRVVDMLKVRLQRQPMLPKHIALQVLAERSHHHIHLNGLDPEGFPGRYLSSLHEGVHDELLLGFAVGVPEAVKALVGHANKLGMLLLLLLVIGRFVVGLLGLLIRSRNLRPLDWGQRLLGVRCGYLKDFGAA